MDDTYTIAATYRDFEKSEQVASNCSGAVKQRYPNAVFCNTQSIVSQKYHNLCSVYVTDGFGHTVTVYRHK